MSNHTPGPWRWGYWEWHSKSDEHEFRPNSEMPNWRYESLVLANRTYGDCIRDSSGPYVGKINIIDAIAEPEGDDATVAVSDVDMALIAAAPDLLAACKEAVAMDAAACCNPDPWLTPNIRDRMVAAIAKAEGDTP